MKKLVSYKVVPGPVKIHLDYMLIFFKCKTNSYIDSQMSLGVYLIDNVRLMVV